MAEHHIETNLEIDAAPESIWAILTDFDGMPSWNPFIKSISGNLTPGGRLAVHIHVLVHNSVRPYPGRGHPDGFHVWHSPPDAPGLVVCDCDFAPELGPHYRSKRAKSA